MVTVVHGFSSGISDDPSAASAGKVLPSHWNANHTITMAASSRIAGRKTSGAGAIEELTVSELLDFLSTTPGAIPQRGASAWDVTVQTPGVPAGTIVAYGGASAPTGYLFCAGQAVSRTTYADLFAAIGDAYGAGDTTTTFNVPDLRGRFPVGKDNMGGSAASRLTTGTGGIDGATLGASGGSSVKTLTTTELPAHTHTGTTSTASDHTHTGSTSSSGSHQHFIADATPTGTGGAVGSSDAVLRNGSIGTNTNYTLQASAGGDADVGLTSSAGAHTHSFTTAAGGTHNHTFTTSSAGSGSAFNIQNPCQVVNYIIKT